MTQFTKKNTLFVARSLAVITLSMGLSGCFWFTSKHEGNQLRKDVNRIDQEVKSDVSKKVAELQAVLDKATKLLTRNSANLGTEVDSLSQENAKLTGLVMEAKRTAEGVKKAVDEQNERLGDLEKRIMALENKKIEAPRKTPEAIFTEGKTLFDSKQWVAARDRFKQIVIRHSTANIAPEAQYYRAETHYREADYKAAIGEFQKVFDKYPKSRRADEALFRAGQAAQKLQWCTDARAYYAVMLKRYPRSSLTARAKKAMKFIKRNSRKKKYCRS